MDLALALFDDVSADCKSKSGAAALCREVRSEQLVYVLSLHARAVVINGYIIISVPAAVPQADHHVALDRLFSILPHLILHALYRLHRIGDQVDKYADQLWLRCHNEGVFHSDIRELYLLLVVEDHQLLLEGLVQVHQHRVLCIQFCKCREVICSVRQDLDVFQHHCCHLVKLLLPFRIIVLFHHDQPLDLKLDRSERILDLMGHLAGHLAPCLVSLGLCKLYGRVLQLLHHSVVSLHQR